MIDARDRAPSLLRALPASLAAWVLSTGCALAAPAQPRMRRRRWLASTW